MFHPMNHVIMLPYSKTQLEFLGGSWNKLSDYAVIDT